MRSDQVWALFSWRRYMRVCFRGGYILLVVADNARAIAFYRRHGLVVRETIDAMPYYRAHMSVAIPSDAPPVSAHIMERHAP